MYKDEIKYYTKQEQFEAHEKMLDDVENYYLSRIENNCFEAVKKLRNERSYLKRRYNMWLKEEAE